MSQRAFCLALLMPIAAAASAAPPPAPDLAPLVSRLVDDTARDSDSERRAFDALMNLGSAGVPYIVSHLGDGRRLPEQSIWVRRQGSRDRQGQPWYVHDGLEFVLKVVTGRAFGPQNGHLLPSQREKNTRKWVAWCVDHYPAQASVCRSGSRD
ncbi:MAG: hypothetical protein AAGC76_13190 [Luteibacter sp.]|uniref:hypothetical protein n=1 Tax=Luteibacter TaxID=242605 RepID=UPI00055BE660|nr:MULTISPECIES: hypothetical protein [unclassified Luteibacter]MDQ7996786.1 hypothetical protein [Luteibacter sp.]MDQ8050841.1 hypothetical protein [Luteibacter sp.]